MEPPLGAAPRIKVVGVGGAGCHAVDAMMGRGLTGAEFIALNSDAQSLQVRRADLKLQVGRKITRGLGCGARPDIGRRSIEESRDEILAALRGADLVLVVCGAGGGTGTGGSPVIAQLARELGALTVGVATVPFRFEGRRRSDQAALGLRELARHTDTLIVVPGDALLASLPREALVKHAYQQLDGVMHDTTRSIMSVIESPGILTTDFADVSAVLRGRGLATVGFGTGRGRVGGTRSLAAAVRALDCPSLDTPNLKHATGVLFTICGGEDVTLVELNRIAEVVSAYLSDEAEVAFGDVRDPRSQGEIRVTLLAAGLNDAPWPEVWRWELG